MMVIRAIVVALCLLPLSAIAQSEHAADVCDCWLPLEPQRALEESDIVFVGTATSVSIDPHVQDLSKPYVPPMTVVFRLNELLKGEPLLEVVVATSPANDCGFDFKRGEKYLVYANRSGSRYATGSWAPVKAFSEADPDLKLLRQSQ